MICLNCDKEFEGNFCPNCGQKSSAKKLTFKTLISNIIYGFTTIDRGILFNVFYLTIRPGKTINDYLNGKRKNIFNPISYAILMVSLYLLVETFINVPSKDASQVEDTAAYSFAYKVGKNLRAYFKYIWLFSIIPMSLFSRLFFSKRNFIEHMAIHSFSLGHGSILAFLGILFFKVPFISNPFVFLVMLIILFSTYRKYEHTGLVFLSSLFIVAIGAITPLLISAIMVLLKG